MARLLTEALRGVFVPISEDARVVARNPVRPKRPWLIDCVRLISLRPMGGGRAS